ncbi:MAG: CidA/LrgA family protein [Lachnospiraceae bacterium]|nr:CidA/LrgA family protein [Lachnospiraceae bacterium]
MKYIKQLLIILFVSFIAEIMEYLIPLPVSASVYGLVLMLLGLMTGIIPLEKVEGAADYLVGIMTLMFVPPTVGIMSAAEELKQMGVALVVISVITTLIVMVVTGKVAQFILDKKKPKGGKES